MKSTRIEVLETRIAPAFVTGVFDLSSLDNPTGIQFSGIQFNGGTAGDLTGQSIASAGDVNGDGLDDYIIGAPGSNGTRGGAYVVFGDLNQFDSERALAGLTENQGFALVGENVGDKAGVSVGSAGDFNGDGFDDILIGAEAADTNDGRLYVVFGKASGFGTSVALSSLVDGTGLIIEIAGNAGNDARLGRSVGRAGDFNGDGFDDLIVGAPNSYGFGDAFIYYGSENPTASGLERTTLLGLSAGTQTGISVSGAGDVNGDGLDDVIVGAKSESTGGTQRGAAYLVFGKTGAVRGTINLANLLTEGNGVRFSGTADNDYAGASVSGAGDVNGDGFADVIVGAYGADRQQFRGAAYVVFGSATPVSLTLGDLNGTTGFRVGQPVSGGGNAPVSDFLGYSVSGAGDVNGDGLDDLLIGAPAADPAGRSAAGESYVVFGSTSAFPAVFDPFMASKFTGITINGEVAGDRSGTAVSAAGDVNGDTFADFLVGAPEASPNGAMSSGQAYIIYGGPSGMFVNPTIATSGKSATFTDVDGDLVTVKVSKGTLTNGNFALIKKSATAAGAQLIELNLGAAFDGADVSITAKRAGGGDGKVNLGLLSAIDVDLGKVTVGGDLGGIFAGDATADGAITSLTVGSIGLFGGRTGDGLGAPFSSVTGGIGALKVAGDFAAEFNIVRASGVVGSGDAGSVLIGGSVIGGDTPRSGTLGASDRVGSVTIKGDVRGGGGNSSGSLLMSDVGALSVAGDVRGGEGSSSALLKAAKFGNITIGGSLIGGSATVSGSIRSDSSIGNVTIGGGQLAGSGSNSADIQAAGSIGKIAIGGDQIGGFSSGKILANAPGAKIASVTIGGDASNGGESSGGGIRAAGQIGPVVIKGSVLGTPESPYFIRGGGVTSGFGSLAVKSVKIGGDFEHGVIAGGTFFGNPDAQIGPVSVGGDWIGSSIAAGIEDATGNIVGYGTVGDRFITGTNTDAVAFIQSVTIKGTARGTFALGDHYGIVAEHIGFVSIGGAKLPLTPAISSDLAGIAVGPTPDFIVRELSRTTPIPAPTVTPLPPAGPRSAIPGIFNLGTLASGDGFTLSGVAADDRLGFAVSGAGDVNGDGFDDFLVGANRADEGGTDRGAAYVVFGTAAGFPTLGALNGLNGFKLSGAVDEDYAGGFLAAAGDVNGDGFDDVLVSSVKATTGTGRGMVHVVFGRADFSGTSGSLDLGGLDGTEGFRIPGLADSDFIDRVAGAGDVNGDGFDDVLLGASGADEGGNDRGAAYLIFGGKSFALTAGQFDLATLDGVNGFKVPGLANSDAASRIGSLGDINGDGFDDVSVGSGNALRVILGAESFAATSGSFDVTQLDGTNGFKVTNTATDSLTIAAGVGDVNGDGFEDFAVRENLSSTNPGRIHVIFGQASFAATAGTLPVETIDGTNGFQFAGLAAGDNLGRTFGAAGDMNGDGYADLFAASARADGGGSVGAQRGEVYVIFGKASFTAAAGVVSLAALDGSKGFKVRGAGDNFQVGRGGNGAGDVNGDGYADLLLGTDSAGTAGEAYVIFGGPSGEFIDPQVSADGRTATWTDVDGDLVTLKVSKGTLDAGNFKLLAKSTGDNRAQLLSLSVGTTLGSLSEFDGADITLTARRAGGGDGRVNLGELKAANTDLGRVTISGDLGRILVGDADDGAALRSLTLGSLGVFGGLTQDTGGSFISGVTGPVGAVTIAGDVRGAQFFAQDAATIGTGRIASLTVGGSLVGGSLGFSGLLGAAGVLGPVKIGGDLLGGSGLASGNLQAASLTSLTIGGDLRGSTARDGGTVFIQGDAGKVSIGGSLSGGGGQNSGRLFTNGNLASLTIGGSLVGGGGASSGGVVARGSVGAVTIGGSQIGGGGGFSGSLEVDGSIGKVTIKRDQLGGDGVASALIFARDPGSNIASVAIGGDARGGDADFSGGILAGGTLGPVSITGDVIGTAEHSYFIRGSGPLTGTKSVAITNLKVGGDFERAVLLAGYGENNAPTNGRAQIGAISVGGDWIASSVSAGLLPRNGAPNSVGFFGDGDDVFIPLPAAPALDGVVASIASLTIRGRAVGSLEKGDHHGIVAERIGSATIGGVRLALTPGPDTAGFALGPTPDFIVREVARV